MLSCVNVCVCVCVLLVCLFIFSLYVCVQPFFFLFFKRNTKKKDMNKDEKIQYGFSSLPLEFTTAPFKRKESKKKKKRRATSIKARGVTKAWTNQQVESES